MNILKFFLCSKSIAEIATGEIASHHSELVSVCSQNLMCSIASSSLDLYSLLNSTNKDVRKNMWEWLSIILWQNKKKQTKQT